MPVRNFGAAAIHRCSQAEAALVLAVTEARTWVDGDAISAQWSRVHGETLPAEVRGRWQRAFEPALAAGRVLEQRLRGHVFYAPAAHASLATPDFVSDLERIEHAVMQVVDRVGGAVPVEVVEAELATDPRLALQSPTSVAVRLGSLERTNRLIAIRPAQVARGVRGRVYYTTPNGPRSVAGDHEMAIDRRARAVAALWRAVKHRPFTTHALAAYAAARPHFCIANDTPYGWTNAMQHFEGTGFLVGADASGGDPYFVRWAVRADWEAMSETERAAALRDTYGRDGLDIRACEVLPADSVLPSVDTAPVRSSPVGPTTHSVGVTAARVDVGYTSRSRDMGVLIGAAVAAKVARESDADRRRIVGERPVTVAEIAPVLPQYGHLLPPAVTLATALSDAARIRPGMREASVARPGRVGNVTYYAVRPSASARQYVEYVRARTQLDLAPIARAASHLRDAVDLSLTGLAPIALSILRARWAQLAQELTDVRGRFEAALAGVERLAEEIVSDEEVLAEATLVAESLAVIARLIPGAPLTAGPADARIDAALLWFGTGALPESESGLHQDAASYPTSVPWQMAPGVRLDVSEAAAQLEGLARYQMQTPRGLWARIYQTVRVIRPDAFAAHNHSAAAEGVVGEAECESATVATGDTPADTAHGDSIRADTGATRSGRRVGTYLDRVGFGAHMTLRWGSPMLATFVSRGLHALGELRSAEPLRCALTGGAAPNTEATTVAALALLDDPTARATLAEYVRDVCAGVRDGTVIALADACRGLGPKALGGLATALTSEERAALESATHHVDEDTRSAAVCAIRGWDESWDRDTLLAL